MDKETSMKNEKIQFTIGGELSQKVSYGVMIACLFIGNMFKMKADILGFSQSEGIKGYDFIFSGLGIVFLLLPILLLCLDFIHISQHLKQLAHFLLPASLLLLLLVLRLNISTFLGSVFGELDGYMSIKAGFGFSGWIYLLVAGFSTYSGYQYYVLNKGERVK